MLVSYAQGHKYFDCEAKRGVLVDPRIVTVEEGSSSALLSNPIYDDSATSAPAVLKALDEVQLPTLADGYIGLETDK